MKNNDQRSSLVWLAIGAAIIAYSGKYGLGTLSSPGPGFVPFLSGLAVAGLALLVFLQQVRTTGRDSLAGLWQKRDWPTMLKILAALVLYAVLLKTLGFLVTTFLLLLFLFRAIQPMPWTRVFLGAALTAFGSYLFFEVWLEAQLPHGVFGF
ncbi:MAG TPA: tripartite tricarboxylate transporter TctB family protein [Thermodesulfobacteriota bacterium]|nr:tripartite tricarboxylate transporter TctB family protein [Thermodesulfobacteriota bacterium]